MRITQSPGGYAPPDYTNRWLTKLEGTPEWVKKLAEGKYHVFIGTPSRDSRAYIGFASSLAHTVTALVSLGIEVSMDSVRNSCFAHICRNTLLKQFMHSCATHCLMIDDDMGWSPYAPLKMLAEGKEFIAGIPPMKGEDNKFAGEVINREGDLVTMREVGGAFLLMSREMILKMMEEYKHLNHRVYDGFPSLFQDVYKPDQWVSEDYMFCERWREIGGTIYGYPDIDFEHMGLNVQDGNYKYELTDSARVMQSLDIKFTGVKCG